MATKVADSTRISASQLFIGGQFVTGQGAPFDVLNPADGAAFATVASASGEQVDAAIGAARACFDSGVWSGKPVAERVALLKRLVGHLLERSDEITDLLVRETGCPRSSMTMMVQLAMPARNVIEHLDLLLKLPDFEENPLPLAQRINAAGQVMQSVRRFVPIGVVSAIAAYNFPLFMALWKAIPALATGNCVILRPSPFTPLSTLALADAAAAAGLPAGALNIIVESGAEGAVKMTTDPRVDMVTFTGSNKVGAEVARQAGATLKRVQLELGGKSAQIYLPDALDRAGGAAAMVCLAHAGQGCVLGTRIFVPAEEKDRILQILAGSLAKVVIGDPADLATQMGPVISAAQRERCEQYVAAAVAAGGRVVTGGKRPAHLDRGFYFEPTVLDLPDNKNPAAQDEIFGPVVGVIGYDSVEHAIEMANDSEFGLSGYVYGKDVRKAVDVAQRIHSGTVNVNSGAASAFISSGGWGHSGIGRERGVEGLRVYQEIQVLNICN